MRTLQQLRLCLMLTRRALAQPEIQLHCLAPLLMNLYESAFASSKFGSTKAPRRYSLFIASRMGLPIDILLICFKIVQLAFSLCASFYIIVPFIKFTWYYNRTQQIQRGFFLRRIGKHCRLILSASLAYAVIVILDDPGLPEEHRLPDLPIMKYLASLLMIALLLDTFVVWPVISLIMRRHPDNAKYMFHDVAADVVEGLPAVAPENIAPDDICAICHRSLKDISGGFDAVAGEPLSASDCGVARLPICGHPYCRNCIHEWVRRGHGTCPMCSRWFIDSLPQDGQREPDNWVADVMEEFRREELARARRRRARNV